ncbi:MAG TPA: ATP-binding protein [Thermoanaerobaculia bacterium]|nr:ATP-binding protein [Thermoanaerobaculia bacterium]
MAISSEMGERILAFDWSRTPLGPIESWPLNLKTTVGILLNSRYPMFVWWGREMINLYNDAYIPVLGKRHPDALGRPAPEIWGDIWSVVGPQAETVLNEGRATWNEERLLLMERHGFVEETYFTFSYSPVPGDGGGVAGVFCACTEDTGRVLSERRLKTLRALADKATEARTVRDACALAARTLEGNPNDLPFALLYLLDDSGGQARLAETINTPPESPATIDPDGLDRWQGRAAVLPLSRAGAGELPAGFLVAGLSPRLAFDDDYRGFLEVAAGQIANAIANARAYEEERQRAEALAELDRAKTAFFSNVSHEFRTPLTLMLGPLEELLAEGPPSASRERLEVAHRNALRLLKLVNTLLDFSRIEAGRIQAAYEPTDLAALTADLASGFRSAVERAGLRLEVDCAPLGEPVWVDREMWEKVVLNLLSNAFKFTFAGEIEVRLRREGDHALLTVRDTGTGIPAAELTRIFERFHRVKDARGRTFEGSGIGLSLVQELVKLHGGKVSVESEVDQGTLFTLSIPLGKKHLPADRIEAARSLDSTAPRGEAYVESWASREELEPRTAEPGTRILLADDNADMRDYVRRLLGREHEVVAVADGAEALRLAREQPFDLVLADVMMPRLDGFGLLAGLRSDERTRTLPVILLSARAGEEAQVEGMEAGADDYLVKPFSARELLARVDAHLRLQRIRREAEQSLREADRRKDEFLAMLAHELRNPLAPIRNAVHVLKLAGPLGDRQQWAREIIERQTQHLTRLVDDLLDVSRITRGKVALAREPLDLATIVNRAVETSLPLIDARRHQLDVALPPEPVRVDGDLTRLVQVVGNLLNNAAKYTDEGGHIRLEAVLEDGMAVIRVRDNGMGLPADLLPHIFDLFSQADRSLDRSQGGLGIGLTLVRRLVELHGGEVEARSDGPGQGSEFVVRLPAADSP